MKRSIKVLAMAIVATMLLSMAAFAAEVAPGAITHEEVDTDYSITVNYDASAYEEGDQVTLLVLTGSNEITFAEDGVTPTNVGYIDQEAIEGETGSFTFAVAKDYVLNNEVYVKLGATAKTTAAEDTYNFDGSEQPPVVDPPVEPGDDVVIEDTVNATVSNVTGAATMGDSVGAIYTVALTDAELAGKAPMAFVGEEAVGTVLKSTETGKFIVVVPKNVEGEVTLKAVAEANATVVEFVYGDVDGTLALDAYDTQAIKRRIKGVRDSLTTVEKLIGADVDGNGEVDAYDISAMSRAIKGIRDLPILSK